MKSWYGFLTLTFDCPIVAFVSNDGPFGDRIAWWSTVVLPYGGVKPLTEMVAIPVFGRVHGLHTG